MCFALFCHFDPGKQEYRFGSILWGQAGESLFGTSTADVLKKLTAWLAVVFFAACIILSLWTNALGRTNQGQAIPFTLEHVEPV